MIDLVLQGMYNVIICNIEVEFFIVCCCYGFDIVVYNFFVGGFFFGKIKMIDMVFESGCFSD